MSVEEEALGSGFVGVILGEPDEAAALAGCGVEEGQFVEDERAPNVSGEGVGGDGFEGSVGLS